MLRRLAVVLCVVAAPARAQLAADDFESGNLDAWEVTERSGITVQNSTAAAHRGSRGVRVTDTETTFEDGYAAGFQKRFVETGQTFYTRMWFRLVSRGDESSGGTVIWTVSWERSAGAWSSGQDCQFDYRSQVFCGEQDVLPNLSTVQTTTDSGVNILDGAWHLYEGATLGRGTDAGTNVWAIDGVEVVRHVGLHANAYNFPSVQIGVVYNYDPDFTAVMDFDDVRFGPEPLPTRLALSAEPASIGACTRVDVSLASSLPAKDGGVAGGLLAPYALELEAPGLFADDACTRSATGAELRDAGVALWVRPSDAGTLPVRVAHAGGDLLPGTLQLEVAPAAEDRSYYAVRCAAAPGFPLLCLILLSLSPRRGEGRGEGAVERKKRRKGSKLA